MEQAAVYRLVRTLEASGALRQQDGKGYVLGPALISLGQSALRATRLPEIVRPYFEQLYDQIGETVVLTVLDGDEVVYVDRIEADKVIIPRNHLGGRLPADSPRPVRFCSPDFPTTRSGAASPTVSSPPSARRPSRRCRLCSRGWTRSGGSAMRSTTRSSPSVTAPRRCRSEITPMASPPRLACRSPPRASRGATLSASNRAARAGRGDDQRPAWRPCDRPDRGVNRLRLPTLAVSAPSQPPPPLKPPTRPCAPRLSPLGGLVAEEHHPRSASRAGRLGSRRGRSGLRHVGH